MSDPSPGNKAALITGAAKRIGRGIALGLAQDGWNIAVHYHRSRAEAESLVRELREAGVHAMAIGCDLGDARATASLVGDCRRKLGPLSCLINNAAVFEHDAPDDFEPERWQRHAEVNLRAPLQLAREFANQVPGETVGCIVNLLDQKVFNLNPDFFSYTLTKIALEGATRMLALALAPAIRVCAVAPGITLISGNQSPSGFERAHAHTPLGCSSHVEDVVEAVRFLVRARSLTGETIIVDGGQHLWPLRRDVQFEVT